MCFVVSDEDVAPERAIRSECSIVSYLYYKA